MDSYKHHEEADHLRDHIRNTVGTATMKDVPHMAVSYDLMHHLTKGHHDPVKHVRDELKEAIDYIYKYETTKNPLYREHAEHEINDVREICQGIRDMKQREEAWAIIHRVHEALKSLVSNYEGGAMQGNPRPYGHGGA